MHAERSASPLLTETDLVGQRGRRPRTCGGCRAGAGNIVDPLQLQRRRLRRARAARRRPLRRDDAAHRRRARPASTSSSSTRASKRGQPGDRLYVPTDQLDQVTRYVGGEAPALHRLGGARLGEGQGPRPQGGPRDRRRADPALQRARRPRPGYAFGPDTPWQRELEDAFPYVETPDQLAAIDEVKADMERPVPMDRLICGDVGYGKTEIAVRAAFKAVQDGKQVAVLVPDDAARAAAPRRRSPSATRNFPVIGEAAVAVPDRRGGRRGRRPGSPTARVDVVIGTHRLLTADVRFKDLGLVVVDEEQRFGVEHKEHLKRLRTAVDVLAMSATPIPRTLEMAVTGIREMSVIQTPPEERHPVLTFVGAYDEKQIAAAVRRELLREGQVFYVHNRVESIDRAAARLRELVPEARIAIAHGQMNETRARAGHRRLLGEGVRRARVHDDRRVRPRHRQRQHADRRAGRRAGAVPAAPAARPGRPRPRAGVRVLPVPAGEAAHRDRARPARHRSPRTPTWARACRSR